MPVDTEFSKLLVQLIVRLVIEIGWIVIKQQRTQARNGRRRSTQRKAMQRIARRRRRIRLVGRQEVMQCMACRPGRLAARRKLVVSEQPKEEINE